MASNFKIETHFHFHQTFDPLQFHYSAISWRSIQALSFIPTINVQRSIFKINPFSIPIKSLASIFLRICIILLIKLLSNAHTRKKVAINVITSFKRKLYNIMFTFIYIPSFHLEQNCWNWTVVCRLVILIPTHAYVWQSCSWMRDTFECGGF